MAEKKKQSLATPAEKLPPLAVPVHVQCKGFRCLAYRDENGAWINYHSGEPLEGPVTVIKYQLD